MPIDTLPGSSERWKLVATLGVTFLIAYYDRLNIALAMPLIAIEQGWDSAQTASNGSLLMGLFYAGFGVANIFLSPLGQRIGARKSLIAMIVLWSLFTAMGAVASQVLLLFMASRVLLGLSEGIHPPMMNQLTHDWFAPSERSRANSSWISGLVLSILTAPVVLVPIMQHYGWRTGFYALAVGGLLISLPLVLLFVYDSPSTHPRVSRKLADKLEAAAVTGTKSDASPWRMFQNRSFQLLVLSGIVNNIVAMGISSWLPTYLAGLDGVRYVDLSYLAAIPYAASLLGLALWAFVGDRTSRRAVAAAAGYLGAGALAVCALLAGNLQIVWLTVTLFSMAVFCFSAYLASEFAIVQRVLPRGQIASGIGLFNGVTTMIGGGFGPWVIGGIIDGGAGMNDLFTLFVLCAAVSVLMIAVSKRVDY
jgi:sugar phosphate permease